MQNGLSSISDEGPEAVFTYKVQADQMLAGSLPAHLIDATPHVRARLQTGQPAAG